MIWADRRDYLVGDMTPIEGMPSSLVGEERVSLEWYSITKPSVSVILCKREEKNQKNMGAQRTLMEYPKLWRLLQF